MSKELLCDYKNRLIEKHGYGEEFAQDLAIMAESLEEYFGLEYSGIVRDTVLSTTYVQAGRKKRSNMYETTDDVLDRTCKYNEILPREKKPVGPVGVSIPNIIWDGEKFNITEIERVVALPHYFDANNPDSVAGISRETMRLISGSLRGYSIDGNTLTINSGLSQEIHRLTLNPLGDIDLTPIKKVGSGLEEGLLKYDELKFTREYYDPTYDTPQEPTSRLISGFLSDGLGLKDMLKEARMTKDQEPLRNALSAMMDVELDEFSRRMDVIQNLEKLKSKNLSNVDKINELNKAIETYFETDIVPTVRDIHPGITAEQQDSFQTGKQHEL